MYKTNYVPYNPQVALGEVFDTMRKREPHLYGLPFEQMFEEAQRSRFGLFTYGSSTSAPAYGAATDTYRAGRMYETTSEKSTRTSDITSTFNDSSSSTSGSASNSQPE